LSGSCLRPATGARSRKQSRRACLRCSAGGAHAQIRRSWSSYRNGTPDR
jgi:hypothetical protein